MAAISFGEGKRALEKLAQGGFETALRTGEIVEGILISVHDSEA